MSLLRLCLFGGFQLSTDGKSLAAVNTPRLQSLIAYLALHPGAVHTRQQLAFLLWPDSTEAQARTNLRKLLLHLRQACPALEEAVHADGQTLQWRANASALISVDVTEFEHALANAELERAISLYTGGLLPNCYDDWIAPERERLSQVFISALHKLIASHMNRRDYRTAIPHAQRLLQHDSLNEAAYRTLMQLHALSGDRTSALRTYQTCQQVLQRELGIEPSVETGELYARLAHSDAFAREHAQTIAPVIPLIGRIAEWQQVLKAWERTARKPQCVIIAGEAGIGKTRLAEEITRWADHQGIATALARCYAAEGALAYAPVIAWLRAGVIRKSMARLDNVWLTEVARLLPELLTDNPELLSPGPLTEGWQRQRLFEAFAHAILSGHGPLLLVLDDVQWSDQDTLEWLHFLLHFNACNAQARLMLVATMRSEEVNEDHPLRAFQGMAQHEGNFVEIELGPLNATETATLAAEVVGQAPPSDHLAHLYRETEGNPLFVVEAVRFQSAHAPMTGAREPIPSSAQAVIARRLSQLTSDARDLTGLAATLGREFTLEVLAQASGRSQDALVIHLDELLQRRIIREHVSPAGDGTYDFSHDKIREAAYRSLSNARRQLFHRRAAEAIENIFSGNLNAVSGQIATHYELAGLAEQAVHQYQSAAKAARNIYANAVAIRYYQRAQSLLDGLADRQPHSAASLEISESLGDVLHHITQYDDARVAYQRALTHVVIAHPRDLARLHCKIGNTLRDQREYQEAIRAYKAAEDSLGNPAMVGSDPGFWQAWIQVQLEVDSLYYVLGRVAESNELLDRLKPIIEHHGTPSQRAGFSRNLAYRLFRQNRSVATDEVVAYTKAALAAFVEMGDQAHIPAATFSMGFVLLWHGEPEQAEQPLLEALGMAERTGDASLIARCATYLTLVYRQLGHVEQVERFIARSLEAAQAADMPEYIAQAKANAAWVAWRNADWQGLHESGTSALELLEQLQAGHASAPFQWIAIFPLFAAALHEQNITQTIDYARRLLAPTLQPLPDALTTILEQAIQAWNTNQPEAARALLNQSMALAQQLRFL